MFEMRVRKGMINTGIKANVMQEIMMLVEKYQIQKLIIFGSRARGDFSKVSDIDLAVKGGDVARFTIDLEDTNTLLEYDVIDLGKPVNADLLSSIEEEGKVLYEKI